MVVTVHICGTITNQFIVVKDGNIGTRNWIIEIIHYKSIKQRLRIKGDIHMIWLSSNHLDIILLSDIWNWFLHLNSVITRLNINERKVTCGICCCGKDEECIFSDQTDRTIGDWYLVHICYSSSQRREWI